MKVITDIRQVTEETQVQLGATTEEGLPAIPQIQQTLEYIEKYPIEALRILVDYRNLAYHMLNTSAYNLEVIDEAHALYSEAKVLAGLSSNSASDKTTRDVLKDLGASNLEIIKSLISFTPEDVTKALEPLFQMMSLASETIRTKPSFTPSDGDDLSDRMIWGHTQIQSNDPKVLLHFIIAHGIERYIIKEFAPDLPKDSVLNAMTDTLCMKYAERTASLDMIQIWKTPKNEGGLGWLRQERLVAFEDAVLSS